MVNSFFTNAVAIKSCAIIEEAHLRCYIESSNQKCGSVDFISEKINFNISGKNIFYKGMESIKNIRFDYKDEILVFTFSNNKSMSFNCGIYEFEKISDHIRQYENFGGSQDLKASFFKD
ncbi:hypothetical protein ACFU8T_15185 [Sphingobacterium spiritivorum]|uniref:Uncharacterized protein n=1 Tax=Sphingobacterium spiritivorum ATCC 33861 TaxID=525373 RepID=D7VJ95_SPHSI|nr:hypothetical protein [Sphingobacterium spiritivorum]EFK58948.1 hypothetical protein HMPREF0766_11064 [Sphingobacterium spiritivorum ATCC 33861]QQT36810.1 hypothetical protein I6J01_05120 [Sphingobacterium spiritivorum]WQD33566.1 hypothetical protein U0038_18830 [Sphingobacterium spiritivorum]SUJ25059.1 Uncharacterised protein [Sphingobacterium spiritivorum]